MASLIPKASVLKAATRSYAVQVAQKPVSVAGEGLQVTKLPSGTVVASLENNSPLSRVAVFLRGGSRFDTVAGVSNVLRVSAAAGLSSVQRTGFNMTRVKEHIGAALTVDSDREMAMYSIASNRDSVGESLSLLSSLTSNNSYRYYELPSAQHTLRLKASLELSTQEQVLDLVAKAAFRAQSLGNSIYVPGYSVGKITADQLNDFVEKTHGPQGIVVVGTGVDHEVLAAGAAALGLSSGGVAAPGAATKYLGGDLRVETGGSTAHVAVVGEGAKLGTTDRLACEVAAELLGSGTAIKYGSNSTSSMVRALKGAPVLAKSVSLSYTDAGLLGFTVSGSASEIPKAVSTLVSSLKHLTAGEKDVAGAKLRVKNALLKAASGCSEVQLIGSQLLLTGSHYEVTEIVKAVDAVTPAAVTKAIAKAFSGKLTVAAVGSVKDVPYSDSL